jgi:hypothetical protein
MEERKPRYGTIGEYFTNLDQPMPLGKKIRLLIRNMSIRFVRRKLCCGHHGEPGC